MTTATKWTIRHLRLNQEFLFVEAVSQETKMGVGLGFTSLEQYFSKFCTQETVLLVYLF